MSHTCRVCNGSGKKVCPRCGGEGTFTSGETCYYCQGTGKVDCNVCESTGVVED